MTRKNIYNHEVENSVDSNSVLRSDLVHFAALAASGDAKGAKVFGMRRVRELMKRDPALAHALRNALLSQPNTRAEPNAPTLQRAQPTWESSETDAEGADDLLRIEEPTQRAAQPVYAPEVRTSLGSIVAEYRDPTSLQKLELAPTKTLLLSGPPGVGKSLAASWLARMMNSRLLILDLGTVMSRYLGATGTNLRRAFSYTLTSHGILFLDELDALAKRRDDTADVGELKRLVTVLLQLLDEWPAGRLLVAATNHPQLLDDAVWRRFEARIDLPRPSAADLVNVMNSLTPAGIELPRIWKSTLPVVFADTSQSEFVRVFSQLRKSAVVEPTLSPAAALVRVIRDRMGSVSRKDAKAIALALANEGTLSMRQISELTHVSRDTMRRADAQGG